MPKGRAGPGTRARPRRVATSICHPVMQRRASRLASTSVRSRSGAMHPCRTMSVAVLQHRCLDRRVRGSPERNSTPVPRHLPRRHALQVHPMPQWPSATEERAASARVQAAAGIQPIELQRLRSRTSVQCPARLLWHSQPAEPCVPLARWAAREVSASTHQVVRPPVESPADNGPGQTALLGGSERNARRGCS